MVSIWWIVWAFLVGGYAGMLLVALVVLARKVRAPASRVRKDISTARARCGAFRIDPLRLHDAQRASLRVNDALAGSVD
jgi:hypothetical protein